MATGVNFFKKKNLTLLGLKNIKHKTEWLMFVLSILISVCGAEPVFPSARSLQNELQRAVNAGATSFVVPPGDYNCSSEPFLLTDAHGLVISAWNSTLWFGPGGGLELKSCSNVVVQGLTIDYFPTVAQGVVTFVNHSAKSFVVAYEAVSTVLPTSNVAFGEIND